LGMGLFAGPMVLNFHYRLSSDLGLHSEIRKACEADDASRELHHVEVRSVGRFVGEKALIGIMDCCYE